MTGKRKLTKEERRLLNQENKRKADELEADLLRQNDFLRALGLADVDKIPDPVKITKRIGGKIEGRTMSRSGVDFAGTIKGGLSVYFDAKITDHETRFEFARLESKKVKSTKARTQREFLADKARLGAAAFVYVRHQCDIVRVREYVFPVDGNGVVAGIEDKSSISFVNGEAAPFMVGKDQTWFDKLRELLSARRRAQSTTRRDEGQPSSDDAVDAVRVNGEAPDPDSLNVDAPTRRLSSTK